MTNNPYIYEINHIEMKFRTLLLAASALLLAACHTETSAPEDYAAYGQYFTGTELPYYTDEIVALADMSYDDLAAACAELSVADVVARHAG